MILNIIEFFTLYEFRKKESKNNLFRKKMLQMTISAY